MRPLPSRTLPTAEYFEDDKNGGLTTSLLRLLVSTVLGPILSERDHRWRYPSVQRHGHGEPSAKNWPTGKGHTHTNPFRSLIHTFATTTPDTGR
jgi:hypothetical protein